MSVDTMAQPANGAERVAELERELEVMRLRLRVTRLVVPDMNPYIDEQYEYIDVVVEDVLARWLARDAKDTAPADLDQFWKDYADRVEFAPPESGDEFRAEFCPPEPEMKNTDAYYAAVWEDHVDNLRQAAGTAGVR